MAKIFDLIDKLIATPALTDKLQQLFLISVAVVCCILKRDVTGQTVSRYEEVMPTCVMPCEHIQKKPRLPIKTTL